MKSLLQSASTLLKIKTYHERSADDKYFAWKRITNEFDSSGVLSPRDDQYLKKAYDKLRELQKINTKIGIRRGKGNI